MAKRLTVGSLFSGIGGLDLGLERAGMEVVWQSEIDPYASKVLAKHWPAVPNLGDIRKIDWSEVEPVDLICGGYPCQPFSLAGSRGGTDDPRHLWPEMFRAIRVLRPRYALMENVAGHLSLGFGDVLADLASCGYDAEWDCIPASSVGAPHRRDRLWIVAYPQSKRRERRLPTRASRYVGRMPQGCRSAVADPDSFGHDGHDRVPPTRGREPRHDARNDPRTDGPTPQESHGHWTVEPTVGRLVDGLPHRVDRLRSLGNAVVPQVAEFVGRRIMEHAELVGAN